EGYLCQKAARLDHYQNHADRLGSPLRRRADGSYEEITWDVALREIAQRLLKIRAAHGGRAFAFYGGGGQGNHLGGLYSHALVGAMRSRYHYSSLGQEKTGDFWVNGRLFGKQTCHVAEAVEEAELVLFVGTNPWQAHGIRNARDTLRALSKDETRRVVVIDPKRTETAELADLHLQLVPGTDAFLLAAILAECVRAGPLAQEFHAAHTTGFDEVRAALLAVATEEFAKRAGVPFEQVRTVATWLREARSAAVRADLGLQQSLHSTINSYLEKLLALVPGHFGRAGCNTLHSLFLPLVGHSPDPGPESRAWRTQATGVREIGKLFPPNVLPAEIDNERAERVRALWVDSGNLLMSGADTQAYRQALAKLELLVVVDVAMTETARLAHYVLPASSQFEKWETTFFNLEFPTQALQVRAPILPPKAGTLAEPELYRRLLVELGELPRDGFPLLRAVAKVDRALPKLRLFPLALAAAFKLKPALAHVAAFVLQDTLGAALPEGAAAVAPLWGAALTYAQKHAQAVRRAGHTGAGADLGEALFARLLGERAGVKLSTHTHEEAWRFVRHADGRVHLAIPELLAELGALAQEPRDPDAEAYPLVLIAGERRSYNANQIFRDPEWRKADRDGALHLHPQDARALGLTAGARVLCESKRGRLEVSVQLSDKLRPGLVTLPHGFGQEHPDATGTRRTVGPQLNVLTDAAHRDPLTATPYHKHVRVRLRALTAG
ncbi:MAG: molybdopterin-dependent oxidoreductase, partial [Deltaproteobacteria bacterium]|nr:molybdopterin-dependent oxidoreductase [Deltaproteobacteria bacterium]